MDTILKERILDFHSDGIPDYIKRDIQVKHIKDMVTTIVGGRKTGKTYLTYQIIDELLQAGKISSLFQVCYLHFDDETLMQMKVEDLSRIDKVFLSLLSEEKRKENIVFVFDEIHKVEGWENFVLRLKKKPNYYVVITGSSTDLEEDKVGRELRGKTFTNRLYPLSFREFLRFKGCHINLDRMAGAETITVNAFFDEYLERGSYPAVALVESSVTRELLRNYFNSVVASDFILNKNISNPVACKVYLKNLLQQNACPYTHKKALNNLKSLGYNLGGRTITDWYKWAEDCYLIGTNPVNSSSIKRIEQNYRKIYCTDWAMANIVTGFQESKISRTMETLVYWELVRQGFQVSYELVGDRKYEIDFIVSKPGNIPHLAIQVCVGIDDYNVLERETRGFYLLQKKYKNIDKIIVTIDTPSAINNDVDFQVISLQSLCLSKI